MSLTPDASTRSSRPHTCNFLHTSGYRQRDIKYPGSHLVLSCAMSPSALHTKGARCTPFTPQCSLHASHHGGPIRGPRPVTRRNKRPKRGYRHTQTRQRLTTGMRPRDTRFTSKIRLPTRSLFLSLLFMRDARKDAEKPHRSSTTS